MRGAARHAGDAHVECTSGHFAVTVCVVIQYWRWNATVFLATGSGGNFGFRLWYRTSGAHGPRPRAEGVTVSSAQGRGARVRPRVEGVTVSSARGRSVKRSGLAQVQPDASVSLCHVAACGINGVGPYYSTQDGATSYLRIFGVSVVRPDCALVREQQAGTSPATTPHITRSPHINAPT